MRDVSTLWSIEPKTYVILVTVVVIEALGIVQGLKRKCPCPTVLLAFIVCLVCGTMQSSFVPPRVTSVFNIVMCGFSVVTLAAQAVIKAIQGLPDLLMRRLSK